MQNIYIKTYFPKQRSVALIVAVGLVLTLISLLSDSTEASGATVSASGGSCTQTVGSSTGVSVAVVNGKCVVTFANTGTTTWTVPTGVGAVRTLVVGGGGGAGGGGCNWMYGRGGGGGAVVDTAATAVTAGASVNIIVGAGGAAAVSRTVGGVINSCNDGLPYSVGSTGGQGGSSQFGTATAVIGGYSSPATTSAGGSSGNGNIGSGSAGAANTLNSWSGGGGGGAGGPGTYSGSGSNWACGGGLFGNGGPGLSSDITGISIGHGGGGAGHGCSGNGSATSGGDFYSAGVWSGTNYSGSYGGGGTSTTGGAGVVIISYIPVAARLIGNGGTMKTFTGTGVCTGGMRGVTSDGTYVYFRTQYSASNICIASLSSGSFVRVQAVSAGSLSSVPSEQNALTYSSGCIFVRNSISAASTVHCIDTTTWVMSSPITPTGGSIPAGGGWLSGNLMNFPDGRVGAVAGPTSTVSTGGAASGANVCPTGSYCKILRTYTVTRSGGTASLVFSADFTLVDPNSGWPSDDHGMATDGTYLYQMMHQNGYKVWALNSGTPSPIIFDGAGTGACTAPTGISGSFCPIYLPISATSADNFGAGNGDNATFFGRSHSTNQYIMGSYNVSKFWVSDAVAPPQGPGSAVIVSPGAPTIGVATATGGTTATVAFTAPASDGGATITSYTATSSPAGGTGTLSQAGSGTISVTGLSGGVDYTFTVTATNSVGTSSPSAASNLITTTQPTASSGQLPTVLTVDPQSSSRYLPTTLNTVGPTNLLLCLNESDASGVNLVSPTINFDVAANGVPATTAGTGTSTIYGDRTTATYIYGVTANVVTTLNSVLGTQIYLSSGAFSATKYIKIRAISIASSSSIGSKTCASTVYTSQNIEIRPLVLQRIMKKGTITLKQ